ncbi:hypothetical protein CPAR01_04779 [Colletotrichum paranaense]|uniref:Uncharacterized protein n=1 Tax=Colletotrichum paranaense TaxID=1914294 RepID=A0ABQ9SYW6_9PEZI|nr:uncharacterized protein CPAR01_04779 [Colletotrichum paranaense]KAK1544146.1 hypothetical protein CPAR01_04779 [Colletotrichum paranaense]
MSGKSKLSFQQRKEHWTKSSASWLLSAPGLSRNISLDAPPGQRGRILRHLFSRTPPQAVVGSTVLEDPGDIITRFCSVMLHRRKGRVARGRWNRCATIFPAAHSSHHPRNAENLQVHARLKLPIGDRGPIFTNLADFRQELNLMRCPDCLTSYNLF